MLAPDRRQQPTGTSAAKEPCAPDPQRPPFGGLGRNGELGRAILLPDAPRKPLQSLHRFGELPVQIGGCRKVRQQARATGRRPRELGANRRGVLGVPALLPQRLVVRRSSDGLRHPIRKCFAGLAVPSAQQHSRGDIAIRTFDGDIHGAVVRRRDQHGFPVEPRIGHRIHHQLRLAGAGEPRPILPDTKRPKRRSTIRSIRGAGSAWRSCAASTFVAGACSSFDSRTTRWPTSRPGCASPRPPRLR